MAPPAEARAARRVVTGFDAATLDALRVARTVRIETSRGAGQPVHETIIWIVVDDGDRVLVRSVRGRRRSRWYREIVANPRGAVMGFGSRVDVRAEPATDHDRIEACSDALRAKYPGAGQSLASMLRDEVLDTTLELKPG
jgi:hypothetical protein